MTNKSYKVRNKESEGKSNQKAYAKKKLKQQEAAARILSEMPSEILRDYHRMNLDQKYEFTFAGYVFGEYPNHRAIYVDRTKMTTEPGFDR